MRNPDFLKYWRIVRYYYQSKYNLSQSDLEMILFLYSEVYFSEKTFYHFNTVLKFNINRLKKMMDDGWVELFRPKLKDRKALYQLTYKSKRLVNDVYRKLEGESFVTNAQDVPLFKGTPSYTEKRYKRIILELNQQLLDKKFKEIETDL